MMFGYACDETPEYMPMAIALAHRVTRRLAEVRKNGLVPYLRPDGKAQVTVEYQDGLPVRVDTVVLSTQHSPEADHATIERDMVEKVIQAVIPQELLDENTRYLVNPTGRFVIGGLRAIPASPGARSSWIPTAATATTAAAPSLERTRPR
jgi:S-adenosylmethionine synthetase